VATYAAYGGNLDPDQMRDRCPHSPVQSVGWLRGWRMTFGGEEVGWDGALVTVVEDPDAQTYVMLYDVSPLDEKVLDEWEGAGVRAGIYDKLRVRVETLEGEVLAWTYVLIAYEGGLPSCHYLGLITEAAEKAGAPADYVAALRSHPCTGSSPTD
jgi:AIG2-like family